jgi:CRISPR/Cas system-associated endoribonuclease Cas2
VCQIEHNAAAKTTEIAVKVFADDLEKAVSGANNNTPLHLNTKQEIKNANDLIRDYLLKSLKVNLNNKAVVLKWLGKEYEKDDATWCYFEVAKQKPIKTVWVQNSIFTEIYPKQNNIVQVKTPKSKKSLSLSRDDDEGILSF